MSFKYRVYTCNRLLSTMANTLPNAMNKSVVEFISSARQRLETVRHCSGTMAATFPAHTLAAVMGPDLRDNIVLLSEQGKYSDSACADYDMQTSVFSHGFDIPLCQTIAAAIGRFTLQEVHKERMRITKELEAVQFIQGVCNSIDQTLDETNQDLLNAEDSWKRIGTSSKIGSILSAKERSDRRIEMEKAVAETIELHESEKMLKESKAMMQKAQRDALIRAGGNPMLMTTSPQEKYAMDVIKEQIREVESRLRPSKDERDQTAEAKSLDIPDRLDADKFSQIIGSFSGFAKQFSHKLTIARHYIERIGHDVHPDTGVFWGIENGELPHLGNDFAGLPDVVKPIYKKETMWLWDQMVVTFEKAGQTDIMEDLLTTFRFGLHGERKFKGVHGDGVLAYWCLLSRYRPTGEKHRATIEKKLNASFRMFRNKGVSYEVSVATILPIMKEARKISLKIKWMHTGSLWMDAMENDAKMTVALEKFKKGGPDPDDCIVTLMDMAEEISATSGSGNTNAEAMLAEATAGFEWKESDELWREWQEEWYPQSQYHREAMSTVGICWYGTECKREGCTFQHVAGTGSSKGKDKGKGKGAGKGKGKGKGKSRGPRKCFKVGCSADAYRHYEFCTECHKKHLPEGGCICKDNQWHALDGAARDARAFYAGGESHEAYQESAIAAVDHLQQQIDDKSISEEDLHSSIEALLSAYQGMPKHAANAKREAEANFAEQEPKRQKEGMSHIESLLSCVQERKNAHIAR